jgi:hypothetical protein
MGKPFVVPVKQAQDLAPRNDEPIPAGAWQGTVEESRVRGLDFLADRTADQLAKQGFTSADVEVVSLQIGSLQPMEGQDDVGNRKFFTPDIVLRDGEYSIEEEAPEEAWQLQRSQRAITNLALALGFVEEVEVDGEAGYVVVEDFFDMLRDGKLRGQQIGFVVYHRAWKSKDGSKSGVNEEVNTYMPAV